MYLLSLSYDEFENSLLNMPFKTVTELTKLQLDITADQEDEETKETSNDVLAFRKGIKRDPDSYPELVTTRQGTDKIMTGDKPKIDENRAIACHTNSPQSILEYPFMPPEEWATLSEDIRHAFMLEETKRVSRAKCD